MNAKKRELKTQKRGKRPVDINEFEDGAITRRKISILENIEAMDAEKPDPETFARKYQLDTLLRAINQNTIAYLDTGAGKTLIATMLIRSYAHLLRKPQNNIAIFMVPTVVLVQQQADVLEMHTDLKVGRYWGAMGVDLWDRKKWQEDLNTYEVFVMTPQIFLDNLRHCFFPFEAVQLMIFDECHHTRKKTPYACIMNEFYHRKTADNFVNLPRIFGMTASPVYSKGTTSSSCISEVVQLETILNAKVYTLEDTTELESIIAYPDLKISYYDSHELSPTLLQKLSMDLEDIQYKHTRFESCDIHEETREKARKKITKLYLTLLFCAEEMGIWCCAKASEILLGCKINTFGSNPACHDFIASSSKDFLKDALNACNKYLPSDGSWRCGNDLDKDVSFGYLSSKLQCLVQSLSNYRDWEQLRCIVFVRRVITAMVIGSLLRYLHSFSEFKSEYIAGYQMKFQDQTQKQQTQIIEEFRNGKVNVIVATQVLEEGLDIKGCNLVIRYDLSDTICSFIQSRGRARMQGSHYVLLVKRGDVNQEKHLHNFLRSEQIIREAALHRTLMPSDVDTNSTTNVGIYSVLSTGAVVSLNSSVALIHYYCAKLPGDRYYTPRPIFHINKEIGECIMELPRNCPVLSVKVHGKISLLKQIACLEACKQLHAVGALNDYLLPVKEEDEEDTCGLEFETAEEVSEVLYPLYVPYELVGDWDLSKKEFLFHCYYLSLRRDFTYTFPFCDVLLLLRHKLDASVENMHIQLQTTNGGVSILSAYSGPLELSSDEVEIARKFQVTIFGLLVDHNLGKVNTGLSAGVEPEMMYLLLPVVGNTCEGLTSSIIDWACIRNFYFPNAVSSFGLSKGDNTIDMRHSKENCSVFETNLNDTVQTVCGMISLEFLQDCIVETPHNGRLYCVTNVCKDLDANSAFASEKISAGQVMTYSQHFKDRYGINIRFPRQPLLCARPLFTVHNYLLKRPEAEKVSVTKFTVELPPELCNPLCCGISTSMLYTYSFLPSVMHRIESMVIAAQLQKIFSTETSYDFNIPIFKVLEALTRKKCQECMSLEAVETLGDAFLKYVSSKYLFTTNTREHEGQLSAKRTRIISNYALYKIGCGRQIPGYIRDECFDPRQWLIPGQHVISSALTLDKHIKGYRFMKVKIIADVVEALIGACLDAAGEMAALNFIKWLGINIDIPQEMPMINNLNGRISASLINIPYVESLLNYSFHNHILLVESLTHASYQEPWISGCYQRLEFLGDAVLDYLITLYLYRTYPGLSPGLLTDLKSATVNNDHYAYIAVKWNLQQQLLHASSILHRQITDFVLLQRSSLELTSHSNGWCTTESTVPKVLGDLIESIAGAILVDSGFDTNLVWKAMKPLLEPIMTPECVPYHPVRELQELCQKKSCVLRFSDYIKEGIFSVQAEVRVGDCTYTETCDGSNKRTAKKLAAEKILKSLKKCP